MPPFFLTTTCPTLKAAELETQEKQAAVTNALDLEIYRWAVARFCAELCEAGLMEYDDGGVCKEHGCGTS